MRFRKPLVYPLSVRGRVVDALVSDAYATVGRHVRPREEPAPVAGLIVVPSPDGTQPPRS